MNGILTTLADLLLPPRCAGCRTEGFDCCPACLSAFGPPRPVVLPGVGPPVYALADYRDAARELVLAYKERGRHTLAEWFGALVALALPTLAPAPWWVVPAPSRPAAVRERGSDHMMGIAERVHTAFSAPVLRLAGGVRDSVGLDADARRANLAGRMRVARTGLPPPGGTVVVLDDVVTTGATARTCVDALATRNVEVSVVLALTTAASNHSDVSIGSFRRRPQG